MKDWPVVELNADEYAAKIESFARISAVSPGSGLPNQYLGAPMIVDDHEQKIYVFADRFPA